MQLFATRGRGTAVPWNPPKKLVIEGPCRHVRNPTISSVPMMPVAKLLPLAIFALFLGGYMVYFPFVEALNPFMNSCTSSTTRACARFAGCNAWPNARLLHPPA
jgi:hypothetical protein